MIYKSSEPDRDKLILADDQMQKLKAQKKANLKSINELNEQMEQLRIIHGKKNREIKKFEDEIDNCFEMKTASARLLNELAGERQKWKVCEDVSNE